MLKELKSMEHPRAAASFTTLTNTVIVSSCVQQALTLG